MLEVIKPGLETSIQDHPGRIGYLNLGFPWSSAMDSWSFRLANILVGNAPGAAGLECQYIGPSLRVQRDTVIAVTGADMQAKIDGAKIPMWESVAIAAGQSLEMAFAKTGSRGYIAIAGGIYSPEFLGSRSTFHKAGVGGMGDTLSRRGRSYPLPKAMERQAAKSRNLPARRSRRISTGKSKWCVGPMMIGSTKPDTSVSYRRSGNSQRKATAPVFASKGRIGHLTRRPTTSCRSMGPTRQILSIKDIPLGPSISAGKRQSFWLTMVPVWAGLSIHTLCHNARSGSWGKRNRANYYRLKRYRWTKHSKKRGTLPSYVAKPVLRESSRSGIGACCI